MFNRPANPERIAKWAIDAADTHGWITFEQREKLIQIARDEVAKGTAVIDIDEIVYQAAIAILRA